jgi:hypothetical protein
LFHEIYVLQVVEGSVSAAAPQLKPGGVYASRPRPEYVPPRAFSGLHADDEDDAVNKGCYYFVACLDSLWVL